MEGKTDRGPLTFNLIIWLVMLIAALALVANYGSNVPTWDDWDMVPAITGHQPVTMQWLWSQHNEHRLPLPRLLLFLILTTFGRADFRLGMFFNVLAAAVFALVMIFTARRVRGRTIYADAFFTLVLMNWGQAVNFLWCWQVQFYTSMLLAGVVLSFFARAVSPPRLTTVLTVGACAILLGLSGANGLALVPALALWLGYTAILYWRRAGHAQLWTAILIATLTLVVLLLVPLYFWGYTRVPYHASTSNPRIIIRTALQFLTMGFGPGIVALSFPGRVPGSFWRSVSFAVIVTFLVTAVMLVIRWWKEPIERARAAGLIAFLGAMASLALGLGMGRDGFEIRYVTLSVPAICAIYFTWSLYGAPWLRSAVRVILFATTVLVLVPNTWWGWRYADDLRSHLKAFEADMIAGSPPYQLVHDYAGTYLHPHQLIVMDYLPFLRQAGVGAFRHLCDDPPFREVSLPLKPFESNDVTFANGISRANGMGGNLTFALPTEMNVAGIRIRYIYTTSLPYLAIYWKSQSLADFRDDSHTKYSPTGDRANWGKITWARLQDDSSTIYAWVCQPVQMIRILPMSKATIDIREVTLLVSSDVKKAP